jgi:hypothetical protein
MLLHVNAHPLTVAHTAETLGKLMFVVMLILHTVLILPLLIISCFVCPKRHRQFISDQKVKEVMHAWLDAQLKMFSSEDIRKLV